MVEQLALAAGRVLLPCGRDLAVPIVTAVAAACITPPRAGLIDAHLHLIYGGLSLSRLDLSAATSREQFVAVAAAAAAGLRPGQWLLGGAWDESRWGGLMPSAEWIDAGEKDVGMLLFCSSGQRLSHAASWLLAATACSPTGRAVGSS